MISKATSNRRERSMIYARHLDQIVNDPSASFWLKDAVKSLAKRDPVDSVNDLECLLIVARERLDECQEPFGV